MSKRYSCKEFEEAIKDSGGIISTIAKRVGCDWNTAKKYINEHSTLMALYNAELENNLDIAEGVILTNIRMAHTKQSNSIKNGTPETVDSTDAKWFVSKKGKGRGYTERTEQQNFNFDLSQCTNEQLQRIANGEDPLTVIAGASAS